MENPTDDRGLVLVDLEIKYLVSAFVDATLMDEAIAIMRCSPLEMSFLYKLFHPGSCSDGGLDALARCLPKPNVVEQLIDMGVKPLLAFFYAPHFDPLTDKPLHDEGGLVLFSADAVEHENKQHVELFFDGSFLKILNGITVFCRNFEA